jgi:D-alanyl-D-alanine dipeptidase
MTIRVLYNIILVRLGIRKILPREAIQKIIVNENNDPLVEVPNKIIKVCSETAQPLLIRKNVFEKLIEANALLNTLGYSLIIFDGYRSVQSQKILYEKEKALLRKNNPLITEIEINKILKSRIAGGDNPLMGGHTTGGAVDVGLCTSDGTIINLGTDYLEFNENTYSHKKINNEIDELRSCLRSAMEISGFINYPCEWWHFCYGDRMWAAYSKKKVAFYSTI